MYSQQNKFKCSIIRLTSVFFFDVSMRMLADSRAYGVVCVFVRTNLRYIIML